MSEDMQRVQMDYAVPVWFYTDTGEVGDKPCVILDMGVVIPMQPQLGEQRAIMVFGREDAERLSEMLVTAAARVPSINETEAPEPGEETNSE